VPDISLFCREGLLPCFHFSVGEGSMALYLHTLVTNPAFVAEGSGYVLALAAVLFSPVLSGVLKLGSVDAKSQGSTS